jgi:hypothetical protein
VVRVSQGGQVHGVHFLFHIYFCRLYSYVSQRNNMTAQTKPERNTGVRNTKKRKAAKSLFF